MNNIKEVIRQINIGISRTESNVQVISFLSQNDLKVQRMIIANMAIMYSYAGENVLIVDTDFSSSAFSETFGLDSKKGLVEYLEDHTVNLSDILNKVPNKNVTVLSSKIDTAKKPEKFLLSDPKFNTLIQELSKTYSRILINSSDFSKIDSLKNLLNNSDGEILLLDSKMNKRTVYSMVSELRKNDANILGYIDIEKS